MCFEDILTLRIYADTQNNLEVPEISNCTHDSIISLLTCILNIQAKIFGYITKSNKHGNHQAVFYNFLPSVFGMKPASKMSKGRKSNPPKKRKKLSDEVLHWVKKLEQIDSLNRRNHGELSINFRESFMNFCKRFESETAIQIREEMVMNNYTNDNTV